MKQSWWIFFPRTKIQHTNTIDDPWKWPSTCIMQHNEECDGIIHGSIIRGLFENYQKATSIRMALTEMGRQQPPSPVSTDNTTASIIVNGMAKQKRYWEMYMRSYWFRDIIQQNHFHIFWEEGKKNLADYVTKHHPIWHHITMRPRYVKETKKGIENSKDQRTGTRWGCDGTTNPGGNRK